MYNLLSADLVHHVASFLDIRARCSTLLPTCHQLRSHVLTSPSHASDDVLPVSAALLRSLCLPAGSPQYAQYVSSLLLSLHVEAADTSSQPQSGYSLTPEQLMAACGLPTTHRRPQSLEQYKAEAEEEDEEKDEDARGEEAYARYHAKKTRFDYGEPLVLDMLSSALRIACNGITRLTLTNVSLTMADLSLLLSCTPRLRSFRCDGVQHVTAAALLLLARHCPLLQHISLSNPRSSVLRMTKAQLDAAKDALDQLNLPPPAPPAHVFTSLLSLNIRLADFEADVDEAGFAQLVSLLSAAPLRWLRFSTMAALPAASFALLARFDALRGLDMACCCRPSVFALLYGSQIEGMWQGMPDDAVSEYTKAVKAWNVTNSTANCTRRFLSPAARIAFFDAVSALPTTPDDRDEYVAARETDVDEWPKADIDFLLLELPRERRRRFFYGGCGDGFDSEDE